MYKRQSLGIIHNMWKPIQQRIKDFIAMPKPNKYQSLHTTVFGPGGERIEIQIRTYEMDFIANEGIAAHWLYKDYSKLQDQSRLKDQDGQELSWLRRLLESHKELKNPREFLQSVKLDLYPEDVFVFTPRGEVLQFPVGATPLDFAYSVHTQLGHQCSGAKVNGQIVKLNYELKSGDVVEILRTPKQHPSKDWMRIAKTSRARNKIQTWLRTQAREQSIALGREMLEGAGEVDALIVVGEVCELLGLEMGDGHGMPPVLRKHGAAGFSPQPDSARQPAKA